MGARVAVWKAMTATVVAKAVAVMAEEMEAAVGVVAKAMAVRVVARTALEGQQCQPGGGPRWRRGPQGGRR